MENKTHSPGFLRKRKFFIVLPLLVVPFVVILFMLFGGGKGNGSAEQRSSTGLNLKLPDAQFKNKKEKDKLGLYEDAFKDSQKIKLRMKSDPYYKDDRTRIPEPASPLQFSYVDTNEKKVMEKLAQLKAVINTKPPVQNYQRVPSYDQQLDKMQQLMHASSQNKTVHDDPELNRIDGMLNKIMAIQHPEKSKDSLNVKQSFSVSLNKDSTNHATGFYGLSDDISPQDLKNNSIEAAIDQTQTLVSGAVIKLRLLQNIYVHGTCIGKDECIYGIATLNNERLKIMVSTIRSADNILPVSLDVYDMDGLEGIYVPGSINREVSKQSANDALSSVGLMNIDPSIGAQAANAGIQAAKTLLSRKVKLIRVTIRSGYQVLLKDMSSSK